MLSRASSTRVRASTGSVRSSPKARPAISPRPRRGSQNCAGRFGAVVGLAHGQQDNAVREAALADFAAGRTRILVATTVIEVGVDVPKRA